MNTRHCGDCGMPLTPDGPCPTCRTAAQADVRGPSRRSRRRRVLLFGIAGLLPQRVLVLVTLLVGAGVLFAGNAGLPGPGVIPGWPGTSPDQASVRVAGPVGEPPLVKPGPDLGGGWTTPPNLNRFITIDGGSRVASDQYLVMLDGGSSKAAAQRIAAAVHGSVAGRVAYIDVWKISTAPAKDARTWYARRDRIATMVGVEAIAPVTLVEATGDLKTSQISPVTEYPAARAQAAPNCAPALDDPVYAGSHAKPYDMIGVRAAWEAYYASSIPKYPVQLGITDTALTLDSKNRIGWEFGRITFVGDAGVVTKPRAPTKDNPSKNGFHHADGVLGIIAADPTNGGIAGIASPLGESLMVTHTVLGGGAAAGPKAKWKAPDGTSYTDAELLNVIYQIEHGATIITGSWGPDTPSAANTADAAMWKKFFDKMAKDHPEVLFVYAAGNEQTALDGTNFYPAGIPAPNVFTVGNVTTGNKRVRSSNGLLPTVQGGEVTLGAPGDEAVWGVGADGKIRARYGGTSSATPMVSATAILMRAIDPDLTAAQIKQMIIDSAAIGDPEVGGKTLRVDLAVRKAIDAARAKRKLGPLTDSMIAAGRALCQISVTSHLAKRLDQPAGASEWSVGASLDTMPAPTTVVIVSGARPANWEQLISAAGQTVTWTVSVPKGGASATVTRLDNGFWASVRLKDSGTPIATPKPTSSPRASPNPTPRPTPRPTPGASSGSSAPDCSEPEPYFDPVWSLKCGNLGP